MSADEHMRRDVMANWDDSLPGHKRPGTPEFADAAVRKAREAMESYQGILREIPRGEAAIRNRDHRIRVAADDMHMALVVLLAAMGADR